MKSRIFLACFVMMISYTAPVFPQQPNVSASAKVVPGLNTMTWSDRLNLNETVSLKAEFTVDNSGVPEGVPKRIFKTKTAEAVSLYATQNWTRDTDTTTLIEFSSQKFTVKNEKCYPAQFRGDFDVTRGEVLGKTSVAPQETWIASGALGANAHSYFNVTSNFLPLFQNLWVTFRYKAS